MFSQNQSTKQCAHSRINQSTKPCFPAWKNQFSSKFLKMSQKWYVTTGKLQLTTQLPRTIAQNKILECTGCYIWVHFFPRMFARVRTRAHVKKLKWILHLSCENYKFNEQKMQFFGLSQMTSLMLTKTEFEMQGLFGLKMQMECIRGWKNTFGLSQMTSPMLSKMQLKNARKSPWMVSKNAFGMPFGAGKYIWLSQMKALIPSP